MGQSKQLAMPVSDPRSIHGLGATIEVRRHPSARRLTLRVSHTRRAVIVTMPAGARVEEAGNFLARHIDWVREKLDAVPAANPFVHGGNLPIRGVYHHIVFSGGNPRRKADPTGTVTILRPLGATMSDTPRVCVHGDPAFAARRLTDWLVGQARKDLTQRVAWHARNLDLRPKRISIRDQTSRWGSCSSTGLLCFSWRLILAPSIVLDYVAAHEVAHLKEMNHSKRFWDLVGKSMPQMDEAKAWLRVNGRDLHAFGRDV